MSISRIPVAIWRKHRINNSVETSSQESSTGSSSTSSSSSSSPSSEDLSPKIETNGFKALLDSIENTTAFPSFKSQKYKEHMNWMKPLPGEKQNDTGVIETPQHIERIQQTFNAINQITRYFLQDGIDENPIANKMRGTNSEIYYHDLLQNEFEKEERYQLLFTQKKIHNMNSVMRGKVVEWIISASSHFKYSVDTVYIAIFLIDAFLHTRAIKTSGWPLLGLTAFHLAGKIEEKSRIHLPNIWKKYKNLIKVTFPEIKWMEQEILTTLKFQVIPTTPKLFADLAFSSGHISFPCQHSERIIKKLCYEILLNSLRSHEMSSVRSSYKAELAMQIATEYVMFYHGIFLKSSRQTPGDLEIMRNAIKICSGLFRTILLQPSSETVELKEVRGV